MLQEQTLSLWGFRWIATTSAMHFSPRELPLTGNFLFFAPFSGVAVVPNKVAAQYRVQGSISNYIPTLQFQLSYVTKPSELTAAAKECNYRLTNGLKTTNCVQKNELNEMNKYQKPRGCLI